MTVNDSQLIQPDFYRFLQVYFLLLIYVLNTRTKLPSGKKFRIKYYYAIKYHVNQLNYLISYVYPMFAFSVTSTFYFIRSFFLCMFTPSKAVKKLLHKGIWLWKNYKTESILRCKNKWWVVRRADGDWYCI